MPYKQPVIEKVYYSISEVADMLNVNPSLIRYWDKELSLIKLKKNKKGNRLFTKEDIQLLRVIYHLVKERGMKLKGAQDLLRKNKTGNPNTGELIERLLHVRDELMAIREELGGT